MSAGGIERDVLIVEDNSDLRQLYRMNARLAGLRTIEAANGREALDILASRTSRPIAIVLDLMMPVMDGWEFLRHRERDSRLAKIPVIVCSASPGEKVPDGVSFLRKPVDVDILTKVLLEFSKGQQVSEEAAL